MQIFPIDAAALAVALPVPAHAGANTVEAFLHHDIWLMNSLRCLRTQCRASWASGLGAIQSRLELRSNRLPMAYATVVCMMSHQACHDAWKV